MWSVLLVLVNFVCLICHVEIGKEDCVKSFDKGTEIFLNWKTSHIITSLLYKVLFWYYVIVPDKSYWTVSELWHHKQLLKGGLLLKLAMSCGLGGSQSAIRFQPWITGAVLDMANWIVLAEEEKTLLECAEGFQPATIRQGNDAWNVGDWMGRED